MKLSLNWLQELLKVELDASKLSDELTMLGVEVENCSSISPKLDKIITAKIEKIDRHPNADKLTVCKVNEGQNILNIVCGAQNIREGDIVPVALPGAVLPGGNKILKAKIRGEISEGMLCSEVELQLGSDKSGIFILPASTKLGISIKDVFNLDDVILEVSLTPNRGDGLSLKGIAREICLKKSIPFEQIKFLEDIPLNYENSLNDMLSVEIEDLILCPLYGYGIAKGVKIGLSPFPFRYRLANCGIRPINNIVDITNYIMLELGHPMHAFDMDTLQGKRIIVRKSRSGEKIVTLDGKEYTLDNSHLIIADETRPIALAGIMGGSSTEVSSETRNIAFECAYFDPSQIRKTSKALGISSEASYRFERSVDFSDITESILKAFQMVNNNHEGITAFSKALCTGKPLTQRRIPLRLQRCHNILGVEIPQENVKEILTGLGFSLKQKQKDVVDCVVPAHRLKDVEREIDIIEEIARVHGYNSIPEEKEVVVEEYSSQDNEDAFKLRLLEIMPGLGMNEVVSYCFISKKESEFFCRGPSEVLELNNPISEDFRYLRTSMIPSLCQIVSSNLNYGVQDIKIFETGKTYRKTKEGITEELRWLSFALAGEKESKSPFEKGRVYDFYDIKGLTETISGCFGKNIDFVLSAPDRYFGEECLNIAWLGKNIGRIGRLSREVLDIYGIKKGLFYGEMLLDNLRMPDLFEKEYRTLKRFPCVINDISFLADANLLHGDICELIRKLQILELETIRLYDIYEGQNVPEGKKSMTYALKFRSSNRTLTTEEVKGKVEVIINALKSSFKIEMRVL